MKNLMQQRLVVMTQKDDVTQEKVIFKKNEDYDNTLIIIGFKRFSVGVTGRGITRTTRTLVKIPTTNTDDVLDFLRYYTGVDINANTLADDIAKGMQFPIVIPSRIATQEFALAIPRYKKGNAKLCVDAYEEMLEKYKAFDSLVAKLTNTIRYAVRKSNEKLLKKMIDQKTGLFDVSLLHTLEPTVLADICSIIDKRLHDGIGKKDINKGILKRQDKGAPSLVTKNKEYILSLNLFVTEEDFEKFPDRLVEHDNTTAEFIEHRINRNAPELLQEMEEEEEEETVETKSASFPANDEEEEEEEVVAPKAKKKK